MRRIVALACRVLACALLAACCLLLMLVLSLLSSDVAGALSVSPVSLAVTRALPSWLALKGALASPFGGVFRGDFALVAVACLVLAKLFRKIARSLS